MKALKTMPTSKWLVQSTKTKSHMVTEFPPEGGKVVHGIFPGPEFAMAYIAEQKSSRCDNS